MSGGESIQSERESVPTPSRHESRLWDSAIPVAFLGHEHRAPSLVDRLAAGETRAAIAFGGQGAPCLDELAAMERESPAVRGWVDAASDALIDLVARRELRWSGLYDHGLDLARWVRSEKSRPDAAYLASSTISQPLILLTQLARYRALYDEGLAAAIQAGSIPVLSGHSQGMMAALLVAESPLGAVRTERLVEFVRYFAWQGLHMMQSFGQATSGDATPMAAVAGPTEGELTETLTAVNRRHPGDELVIALYNTRTRHVVSGPVGALQALRAALTERAEREARLRREGRHGGRPLTFTWEFLAVGAAFHSPRMADGLRAMREAVGAMGFTADAGALHLDVVSPATGALLNDSEDLLEELLVSQFTRSVRWHTVVARLAAVPGVEHVLDLGPGEGVARLSRSLLRGTGVRVHAMARDDERGDAFRGGDAIDAAPQVMDARPGLVRAADGQVRVDNRYTRATGRPPVFLAGMTPTTVDAGIVAAAANAGYTAELAGGGQVTERIFALRVEELQQRLEPGREVIFNALYLDPYLWDLHVRRAGVVLEARRAGAPICGVTVSAGMPEVDEAVRLLDDLAAAGLTENAFKPGTVAQVEQVVRIARAAPQHTIFMHLEGGRAGGHHSWEDLDQLLLDTWHTVREQPNLVLCAGGGVATEERAVALLTGAWSERHGMRAMPVDAVFLGTVAMACAEATTSPQVKQALVEAGGVAGWVLRGDVGGGVTSGRSQLDADIHYLENAAARCGRLLDAVAGDADAVAARRDEIAEALAATARPYFGDAGAMSYGALLGRMVDLMAIGQGGRYEDGVWPDRTWRERVADMLRRSEARLCAEESGAIDSVLGELAELDDPQGVLRRFAERYPDAATRTVHPADARWFVHQVCARPGKPVPFVPVIDADVRRWFKADSLWQAHDGRYDADQVLVIPGPEAVAGITRADEPVAELLGRFERAMVERLLASGVEPAAAARAHVPWPPGVVPDEDSAGLTVHAVDAGTGHEWLPAVASRAVGPIGRLLMASRLIVGGRSEPNPVPRLCRAAPGARLRVSLGPDGRAVSLSMHPIAHRWSEELRITLDGPQGAAERVIVQVKLGAVGGTLTLHLTETNAGFHVPTGERAQALRAFYDEALFGAPVVGVAPFEAAVGSASIDGARAVAYAALTGMASRDGLPLNLAFSLAWEPLYRALSSVELGVDFTQLVHLEHRVEPLAGWPLAADEAAGVTARVTRVEDTARGRIIDALCELARGGEPCARVRSRFFVRGAYGHTPLAARAHEPFSAVLSLPDQAAIDHLLSHGFVSAQAALAPGDHVTIEAELQEERPRVGDAQFYARGVISRGGAVIGGVELEGGGRGIHPVRALAAVLGEPDEVVETPRLRLAIATGHTPRDMGAFAEVGGDGNPLHRSLLAARLAGFDGPIVHGMWTAARLHALLVDEVAGGSARRVTAFSAEFLAPALPGEPLTVEAVRTGVRHGALRVELVASVHRGDALVPVVRGTGWVAPPRTAYVFPGQGIQRPGMGMEGYARSAAARAVWDRADAYTREALGFSILRVVRDNPRELVVCGAPLVHPDGVLHLTQLTQVAMAVLARAQVAELREAGALVEDAVTCGHSVGEYNALGAVADVLSLESLVDLVYRRGLVMHGLVARDEAGESGYRMGVVRPHLARLDHAGAEALVAAVRERTGRFVQIVNFNVRGRQYSVTGHADALAALAAELEARTPAGGKPAWVDVPGIDVPFHSEILRPGVASFREALRRCLPPAVDPARLVGRYVPDLLPRPFALTREFAEALQAATGSDAVAALLVGFEDRAPGELARELLVELLAWQFASPVRWIEVQEALLRPVAQGGLGVERVVEIGVGHQPTLTNMMRATLRAAGAEGRVAIAHVETDAAQVMCRDTDAGGEEDAGGESAVGEGASGQVGQGDAVIAAATPATTPTPTPTASPTPTAEAGPVADRPLTPGAALRFILASQARVRLDQIADGETIDELFSGVSSRRNQALLDLGAELDVGSIDGAHERPIAELARELDRRATRYRAPGRYLRAAQDEALKRVLGRGTGLGRKEVSATLTESWGLGAGLIEGALCTLALESRDGASTRGGALGELIVDAPTSRAGGLALLDRLAALHGVRAGLALQKRGAATGGGAAVDAAVVRELRDDLLGPNGALMQSARDVALRLGHRLDAGAGLPEPDEAGARLALYESEHGAEYAGLIAPAFDPKKHVAFTSWWAWARRDVARLYFAAVNGRLTPAAIAAEAARLTHADERVGATATFYADRARAAGHEDLAAALDRIARGQQTGPLPVTPSRPRLTIGDDGALHAWEERDEDDGALTRFVDSLWLDGATHVSAEGHQDALRGWIAAAASAPLAVRGRTAIVTGASPGSIAVEVAAHLLRGGARVVLTTSTYTRERMAFYRRLYQRAAGPGAELHVVPFNQASQRDVDALVAWAFDPVTEQAGATVHVVKRPFAPDLLLPFAAVKDLATLDGLGPRSEVALRAMLLGVERLVGAIAARHSRDGLPAGGCHVVLPLSPNHGSFGGDGVYGEVKAALEVLAEKWTSEHDAWGRATTLCAARIGWVRGTGLMDANDAVAEALERQAGVRTFSSPEMGLLLAALCGQPAREASATTPLSVDLTGGLGRTPDLRGLVQGVRSQIEEQAARSKRRDAMNRRELVLIGEDRREEAQIVALPDWPRPVTPLPAPGPWPTGTASLEDTVVIVGMGELGPWGSSRTRFDVEVGEDLSPAAVLELAWMTGLVRFEQNGRGGAWVDVESGDEVAEADIAARYADAVRTRSGVRLIEPDATGFDPERLPVLATVYLERDFTFPVGSAEEARSFVDADPEHTRASHDAGTDSWRVTRLAGTEVRVARQVRLNRRVAGTVPLGFDFARHGIPAEMATSVDRVSLMNLVATVDAFLSAGLTPEELLGHLHPARVANTQGGGIGGMRSLHRLYLDHLLGRERQSDALQETLINVVAAYAVQSYVGSYGPMAHPVGACATAAISLEEARDKILAGKADFVVAGGYDDIGAEGMVGFADMNATASSDEMAAMGFAPDQMSRANDIRRRGFVEAHGGGTVLLARGDVALRLGLPVRGVLAWAGSFGDGIHKSIPAPGLGALTAAMGGADSPLGRALTAHGLCADDIAVVSKHDTSTAANDPNENALHDRIQTALGRTPGNPLFVISQKSLTGHAKGGAAAWQAIGLCQALSGGVLPGNRNLESVDPAMRAFHHLAFTDETLRPGPAVRLRAGLVTSLGFGHASGMLLVLHPDAFTALVPTAQREEYARAAGQRADSERRALAEIQLGARDGYTKRTHRRFAAPDGTLAQVEEEAAVLLDPTARLDPATGLFARGLGREVTP